MSSFESAGANALPAELSSLIKETASENVGLSNLLSQLLRACRTIGTVMRNGGYSSTAVGSQNVFGDNQLDVDVKTDAVMFEAMKDSGVVHVAASEENPVEIDCGGVGDGYSVAFDPLDGSSIIDANFAVGTICGVWPGRGLVGRRGAEQTAAIVCQYGPKVTMALALNSSATVNRERISLELTMLPHSWIVSIPKFAIAEKGKTFAPGNLRATFDNDDYKRLVAYWIDNKYTLRYSGGLVPDVYHILIKGQGVLSNASSANAKAKLRLLFECAPIALIIEAAGGASCVCATEIAEPCDPISLLDVVATDIDKRVGVCFGSSEEVQRFKSHIFS